MWGRRSGSGRDSRRMRPYPCIQQAAMGNRASRVPHALHGRRRSVRRAISISRAWPLRWIECDKTPSHRRTQRGATQRGGRVPKAYPARDATLQPTTTSNSAPVLNPDDDRQARFPAARCQNWVHCQRTAPSQHCAAGRQPGHEHDFERKLKKRTNLGRVKVKPHRGCTAAPKKSPKHGITREEREGATAMSVCASKGPALRRGETVVHLYVLPAGNLLRGGSGG